MRCMNSQRTQTDNRPKPRPAPRIGERRKLGRFDLPVVTPTATRAALARRLA
jgi:hypothetical protein